MSDNKTANFALQALRYGAEALDNTTNAGCPNMIEHVDTVRDALAAAEHERDAALKALKLQPGGVYVIESDRLLSRRAAWSIVAQLADLRAKTGIEFLVLSDGLHVARGRAREVDDDWEGDGL